MNLRTTLLLVLVWLLASEAVAVFGITKDYTGPSDDYFHWSSVAYFGEDEETVTNALPSLAKAAYQEMLADFKTQKIDYYNRPAIMTALAVGSDVYFSSSLKGRQFLIWPNRKGKGFVDRDTAKEVGQAILRCQNQYPGSHRYAVKCGEPMALQQYMAENPKSPIQGKGKITSYGVIQGRTSIQDPCSPNVQNGWGCGILINELGVTPVGRDGDQPGPPSLRPKSTGKACFW